MHEFLFSKEDRTVCFASCVPIIPRIIRFRDALGYLGMDRNRFNNEVRPYLTEVPVGTQGIAFDRVELDAWADEHIRRNGRPGRAVGGTTWDRKERQDSSNAKASDISTSRSAGSAFEKAVARAVSRKQRSI